jgi:hypothetical protein
MSNTYTPLEHATRGDDLYQQMVRPLVEPQHDGKVVAIDVDSGAFEVGETATIASERLRRRCPGTLPWLVRIGQGPLARLGFGPW